MRLHTITHALNFNNSRPPVLSKRNHTLFFQKDIRPSSQSLSLSPPPRGVPFSSTPLGAPKNFSLSIVSQSPLHRDLHAPVPFLVVFLDIETSLWRSTRRTPTVMGGHSARVPLPICALKKNLVLSARPWQKKGFVRFRVSSEKKNLAALYLCRIGFGTSTCFVSNQISSCRGSTAHPSSDDVSNISGHFLRARCISRKYCEAFSERCSV